MFKFLQSISTKLSGGDERYVTEKEENSNWLSLPYNGDVVVSTDRKRLYWHNDGFSGDEYVSTHIYQIFDYVLNGYAVLTKQVQYLIRKNYLNNKKLRTENQFMIKGGEVFVDGIYKLYNDPKNYRKEKTLEDEIKKWEKKCLLNPLCSMELTMFILSKTLNRDSLQKAVQEKVKLIKEGKKDYDNMLSKLGIIYNDNYFEMEKQIKEKGKFKEYKEGLDTITKKCGCNDLELTEQKKTIEKIESYLK